MESSHRCYAEVYGCRLWKPREVLLSGLQDQLLLPTLLQRARLHFEMTEILHRRSPAAALKIYEEIRSNPLWDKLVALSSRLSTVTELLNESLRDAEDEMCRQHVLPCSAKFSDGRALVWDGEMLRVYELRDGRVLKNALLQASRKTRLAAVDVLVQLKIAML